jgi:hypothetical protein
MIDFTSGSVFQTEQASSINRPKFAIRGGGRLPAAVPYDWAMKAVERAARAELRALPADLRDSTLAKAALDLARRLDAGPADREATMLARELRMTLGDLHGRAPRDATDDVEQYLARIAAPELGHSAN